MVGWVFGGVLSSMVPFFCSLLLPFYLSPLIFPSTMDGIHVLEFISFIYLLYSLFFHVFFFIKRCEVCSGKVVGFVIIDYLFIL